MKFSDKSTAMLLMIAAVTSNAFSPAIMSVNKKLLSSSPASRNRLATVATFASSLGSDPYDEVDRLRSMAASLRSEAADLEKQWAQERAEAAKNIFEKWDLNQDGELNIDELKAGLEKALKMEVPLKRIENVLATFDTSGDGKIQLEEFLGIEQFKNRAEALAREEKKEAREAAKVARDEAEAAKLLEAQMELINDGPPTNVDKIVSSLPYSLPLMDGLAFGHFMLQGNEDNPAVLAIAMIYGLYRSSSLTTLIALFGMDALSNNVSLNHLVRFNLKQAIALDISLLAPMLVATLSNMLTAGLGLELPTGAGELGSDAVFIVLLASILYSAGSSYMGQTPDKLPFVSSFVDARMPSTGKDSKLDTEIDREANEEC